MSKFLTLPKGSVYDGYDTALDELRSTKTYALRLSGTALAAWNTTGGAGPHSISAATLATELSSAYGISVDSVLVTSIIFAAVTTTFATTPAVTDVLTPMALGTGTDQLSVLDGLLTLDASGAGAGSDFSGETVFIVFTAELSTT